MTTTQLRNLLAALVLAVAATGCESSKGPAGKVGAEVDKDVQKAKDAMDTRGPGEKLGDKIDKNVGK